jgi:hypothetical protein
MMSPKIPMLSFGISPFSDPKERKKERVRERNKIKEKENKRKGKEKKKTYGYLFNRETRQTA